MFPPIVFRADPSPATRDYSGSADRIASRLDDGRHRPSACVRFAKGEIGTELADRADAHRWARAELVAIVPLGSWKLDGTQNFLGVFKLPMI